MTRKNLGLPEKLPKKYAKKYVAVGTKILRIQRTKHLSFFNDYGPTGRFDHHPLIDNLPSKHKSYAVCYAGSDFKTVAAEVFMSQHDINARKYTLLTLEVIKKIPLLNLSGDEPVKLGASLKLVESSTPRHVSQSWARAIYNEYNVGGIFYPSSQNRGNCFVFWEQVKDSLKLAKKEKIIPNYEKELLQVADSYHFSVDY